MLLPHYCQNTNIHGERKTNSSENGEKNLAAKVDFLCVQTPPKLKMICTPLAYCFRIIITKTHIPGEKKNELELLEGQRK